MKTIKRKTAIARLRRDCKKNNQVLRISRSIKDELQYGECYIVNLDDNSIEAYGSIEDVMRSSKLLRDDEEVEK